MKFDIEEEINIDLTPLIDVIFMLLIFFIMTTTFSKPVLDVLLPSSATAEAYDKASKELIITVDKNGAVFHGDKAVTEGELIALLRAYPDNLLNLFIDKNAPFQTFVGIVDIAKTERGGKFVISTDVEERK